MQQIEGIVLGYFGHARGQSEIVGGKFKKWIVGNRDLVIKDAVIAAIEAERLRIGDEMDFVAEGREFNAQLGGDNS
jgi:hypothetical protein